MERMESRGVGRKPDGGFRFITTVQMAAIWTAYQTKLIGWRALRVWFACHELVSRRCQLARGQVPKFSLEELRGLVGGVGGQHIRADLRELERAGLLTWSESGVDFLESLDQIHAADLQPFFAMLRRFRLTRRVPVPRRTIVHIAGCARRGAVAVMLGHLVRCMFYRAGQCHAEGSCGLSWIAETFGVHRSRIAEARSHLLDLGWLAVAACDGWHRQKHGGRFVVNLRWSRPAELSTAELSTTETRPPKPVSTTKTRPPYINKETPTEYKNQNPASRGAGVAGRTGVCAEGSRGKKPAMGNIVPADLRDTARTLALFEDATTRGLVGGTEADRINFMAAADRALAVGTMNPCGLFARLVRGKLWHHLTNADEDAAVERLRRYRNGPVVRDEPREKPWTRPTLSKDARFVVAVRRKLRDAGHRGEAFDVVRRELGAEWTPERWGRAVSEL